METSTLPQRLRLVISSWLAKSLNSSKAAEVSFIFLSHMDATFEDSLGQPFDAEFGEEEHIYSLDEMINVVKVAFKITIQTTDFSNIVQQ